VIVKVNGEERDVASDITVDQLLEDLGIGPGRVAVELNMEVVARGEYTHTHLKAGDRVEIVHFVGGG
jgi:sulfur carrier protein